MAQEQQWPRTSELVIDISRESSRGQGEHFPCDCTKNMCTWHHDMAKCSVCGQRYQRYDPDAIHPPLEEDVKELDRVTDLVNHPPHYNTGKFEVLEIIEDQKLNFNKGNAVKYICRAGHKNKETYAEDLKKAIFYLRREIELLQPKPCRPNEMDKSISTKDAMDALVKALKTDKGYWHSWQSNIAMAFIDEGRGCIADSQDIRSIANVAATKFLEMLCR